MCGHALYFAVMKSFVSPTWNVLLNLVLNVTQNDSTIYIIIAELDFSENRQVPMAKCTHTRFSNIALFYDDMTGTYCEMRC